MHASVNADKHAVRHGDNGVADGGRTHAAHWIARQLEWERTLRALRADRAREGDRRAA